jgi:hypothetical protein
MQTEVADEIYVLADLFKAYRKAKSDAFHDRTHFNAIGFANYEVRLESNLRKLLARLRDPEHRWASDVKFIGGVSYLPKSVEVPEYDDKRLHFATLDPVQDWIDRCSESGTKLTAGFRQIITPTVDYLVLSALWIIRVGHKFDSCLDRRLAFAHAIRRVGRSGPVADDAHHLFVPYMDGYRRWRSAGLAAMRESLKDGRRIAAVTMDVERFYHSVSPNFLVRRSFLKKLEIDLTNSELIFTENLVKSINCWYRQTPDYALREEGALPVGLPASRVISNVLLAEFDIAVAEKSNAIYYGRYADDIFLVVPMAEEVKNGESFIKWLRGVMDGWLVLKQASEGSGLRLDLPYAKDSTIVFSSKKQKIFFLEGEHGLDLLDQISEKIREYSSEYRELPELPDNEGQMAARALLASPDARLEADALRKAEAVSIRRLGFSMLLSDVEAYAKDLDPNEWRWIRFKFYDLVSRYVVTPSGIFDYFVYIIRVYGLMIACGDIGRATQFLDRFDEVCGVLRDTTTAGDAERTAFVQARRHYFRGFTQAAFCAATTAKFKFNAGFIALLKRTRLVRSSIAVSSAKTIAKALLLSDQGRRPYHDYWFEERNEEARQPRIPSDYSVRKVLALTRQFRERVEGGLSAPYWPAVAFPTRPIPLWKLCLAAPMLLTEPGGLEKALLATRGAQVNPWYRDFSFVGFDYKGAHRIGVPTKLGQVRKFGVPSYLTTDDQWAGAFEGTPDKSLARYVGIRRLLNRMLRECPDLNYIALPECSVPFDWLLSISQKLGLRGVSLIAGVENHGVGIGYTNEALISLASNFFGRSNAAIFVQPKLELAHDEAAKCLATSKAYAKPSVNVARPIYTHGGLCFSVLICSDLTTIANRSFLQGQVDALFVLEWNKDLSTFEFLVESSSHDLHACVVQVNNRKYGDSRIRMPFEKAHDRDVVQVKGGEHDFFVVASIDFGALRTFQRAPTIGEGYKPLPIGYQMSAYRLNAHLFGGW